MPTLEELEDDIWPEPDDPTPLVANCHRLRKKNLDEFSPADLHELLLQGIGLKHLAPLTMAILERDPLEEANLYPGALLRSLVVPRNWSKLEGWSGRVEAIFHAVLDQLPADPPDLEINGKLYPAVERTLAGHLNDYLNRRSHKH